MTRVLLVQPSLQPPGGGNAVAAWMVEALRETCEISILAWKGIDCASINRFFATSLRPADFTLHVIDPTVRRLVDLVPTPHAMLQMHVMLRRARALHAAQPYDVLLTANNEADFGVHGIQYVHYPWAKLPRPEVDLRWFHRIPGVLRAYWALCGAVSEWSWSRMRRNLTLVNSVYVAGKVREVHGIEATVLHPPVPGDFPPVPWDDRDDGFVCVGRLSPEKEQRKVIEILAAVRARGHDVRLHLVGTPDQDAYVPRIHAFAHRHASWVELHEDLSRTELVTLMTRQRYGLHGMVGEHFGIAVAELQRAGCVTFAPSVGGPREILGDDVRLLYDSPEDAVAKIDRVLRDRALQRELHAETAARRDLFTTERFVTRFREIVESFAP